MLRMTGGLAVPAQDDKGPGDTPNPIDTKAALAQDVREHSPGRHRKAPLRGGVGRGQRVSCPQSAEKGSAAGAAVVGAGGAAAAAGEQDHQKQDPPPVIAAEETAEITVVVIAAHRSSSRIRFESACFAAHSML